MHGRRFRICLVLALFASTSTAVAGVTTRTEYRDYQLDGSTPTAIVDFFHAHPVPGDAGPALANIRDSYRLNLTTRQRPDGSCGVGNVDLDASFVITLPKADEESAMSGRTRAMWREVVAFARNHELGHRSMFLACAQNFVARASRLTAPSCGAVESAAERLQASMRAACDAGQGSYDAREARRAGNLSLFVAARLARR